MPYEKWDNQIVPMSGGGIFDGLWSDFGMGFGFGVIGRRPDGLRSERNGVI